MEDASLTPPCTVTIRGEHWTLTRDGLVVLASVVDGPSWSISPESIRQRSGEYREDLPMAVLGKAQVLLERAQRESDLKEIALPVSRMLAWREVKPGVWRADLGGELYLRATRGRLSIMDGVTPLHYSSAGTPGERAREVYLMMLGWLRAEPGRVEVKRGVDCLTPNGRRRAAILQSKVDCYREALDRWGAWMTCQHTGACEHLEAATGGHPDECVEWPESAGGGQ